MRGRLGVVVGALVVGAPAGEAEAFAEAISPLAAVGVSVEVERHEREQFSHAGAVGEGHDTVTDAAVDLTQDLLDAAGRVGTAWMAGGGLAESLSSYLPSQCFASDWPCECSQWSMKACSWPSTSIIGWL